ncbi:hypothetical protein, partial [Lysinibacillus sp. NPDC093692]|uniref:hypothetical protein n=1 Tax=Lysinibacillus sp. NPDC093692 TaxID=3390578 RepID=UPI003D0174BD
SGANLRFVQLHYGWTLPLRFRVENNSPCFSGANLRFVQLHYGWTLPLRFRVENNSPCFSGAVIFAMIK